MTALTTDNVRRLDALNLIQAYIDHDMDRATDITELYPDREDAEELISSLAAAASALIQVAPTGVEWLAKLRGSLLDGSFGS